MPPAPHFPLEHDGLRQMHDGTGDIPGAELLTPERLAQVKETVRTRGFVVVRNLLDSDEVDALNAEIKRAVDTSPHDVKPHTDGPPPYVDFDPLVTSGKVVPPTRELGVRRLFRIATNNEMMRRYCVEDARLLAPARAVLGDDLVLIQSMGLLKPPKTGEKRFHQDQGVFRLSHDRLGASCVMGWWIALDRADLENGCMVIAPESQQSGIVHHVLPTEPSPTAHIFYSVRDCPRPETTTAIEMNPGDALFFDVATVHGTGPNRTSDRRRRALQMQYAAADAKPTKCPTDRRDIEVTKAVGEVFDNEDGADSQPTAWFDCDASVHCTEPQYWSFRRPEMRVPK
eukprot:m.101525 g.101525  ORF g.101525 m.101525 type:complete len:342 (+) comp10396_c0_seq1:353-1378(+)